MEKDVIRLEEMAKILHKHPNTVRNLAKKKEIPANKIAGDWYSSKLALSMCAAGYNPKEIFEEIAKKMLKESAKALM